MPRTTTTGDVRPAPSASRYQPPSRFDSSSGGGVFRSGPSAGTNTITRPSPTGTSRSDATQTGGRSTTVDSRYRAGGTVAGAPRADAPRGAEPPRSSQPGRSSGSSSPATAKPRSTTPSVSGRYSAPRDAGPGVSERSAPNARPDAGRGAVKPDAGRGAAKPDAGRGSSTNARPDATATTSAGVRAPRLGGPATVGTTGSGNGPIANGGSTGPIGGGATGQPIAGGATGPASCGGAFPDNSWCASSWGCNYWDPYCGSSWGGCGWGWGWGGCGFSFGISWWWPCWSWSSCWWDHCYSDCWWSSCAYPSYVSSSYWWYPTSTYCPTYLYVPSTVIVADDSYASSEVVVAGKPAEKAADSEVAGITASLASKYVELGDLYFRQSRFTDAVGAYGKARAHAPEDASLHFVLADAVFAEGDYLYAAFLIGEGLRLDPGMASATTDKRSFYKDPATFDAQMAALDRHLERRPDDPLAHLLRGYNLRFSGKPVEAIVAFRRVLELDPGNRAARTFLDALEKPAATEPVIVR